MRRTFSHRGTLVGLLSVSSLAAGITACADVQPLPPIPGDPSMKIYVADEPPPVISGGTMIVARDGRTVVAADTDRDRVWVVDLETRDSTWIPLEDGDEPGRVVEDGSGRAHVALRRGGAVATIDIAARKLVDARDVCVAPRGLAYDDAADVIHVACAGGELVTLPAAGGAAVRSLRLDKDLRDVVVDGDRLLVSRFRSAETLVVGPDGLVLGRRVLPDFQALDITGPSYRPSVAWRMAPLPGGGAAVVHQRAMLAPIPVGTGAPYYSTDPCTGTIVHGAISVIAPAGAVDPVELPPVAALNVGLPVDLAVSQDGESFAIVSAANDSVVRYSRNLLESEATGTNCFPSITPEILGGQPVAVAFAQSDVVVQLREPAGIVVLGRTPIFLDAPSMRDTGHDMFHKPPNTFSTTACASCHPEGGDDSHTWIFDPTGERRTQTVGGGVLATAPLHWSGDQPDFSHLMDEVFVTRMAGMMPGPRRLKLMARFIDTIPSFPASPPADAGAVARGEAIFASETAGCAKCHSGPMLTNNKNEDVGTGESLQVPSLVGISGRAPFMHDGCAPTLRDRFDPACGGDKHGTVAEHEIDDLVAYLESL